MPAVTVIIATYNRSRVLRCALESLRAQTFRDFEAWVVGDACTDDSEAVVASFGDARMHWANLPARAGTQSGPNNEGLRRATGEYVAYLGHDDLWLPWHLETLVDVARREGADFAHAGVVFIGPEGPREVYGNAKTRAQVSVAPPSGWMHRRSTGERVGFWKMPADEPIGVDVGFQARAFEAGCRFAGTRNMSVLKFPSPWWRTYATDAAFPQQDYLSRMKADAARLQRNVLTDLALVYARRVDEPTVSSALKSALRAFQRRAGERYGVERWPLSQYLRWRTRRRRARAQQQRGL
jgi:glycosyltransferase involved in cell wall biosynthesis